MKILIITFTSGNNPGTFMQGLGVKTAVKKMWPEADVDFLKFPDFKVNIGVRDKKAKLWHTIIQKATSAYRLYKYHKLRNKEMNFTQQIDLFNYSQEDIAIIKQYDLVVIGSDTILEKAYGDNGKIGLNWMPFETKKIFFAASASPANFTPKEDLKKTVKTAKFIGLRDDLTISFFINQLGIDKQQIVKQPDPSFFLDVKNFKLSAYNINKFNKNERYVLYNFASNFPLRKTMADELRNIGYKVVTTAYNPYADLCLTTIDAYEWAGVFRHVDLVVTERFHDSVFALRNERPVIAIDWDTNRFTHAGDSKTLCILQDYEHEHLHFNLCNQTDFSSVIKAAKNIDNIFDYKKVHNINYLQENRNNEILHKIKSAIF